MNYKTITIALLTTVLHPKSMMASSASDAEAATIQSTPTQEQNQAEDLEKLTKLINPEVFKEPIEKPVDRELLEHLKCKTQLFTDEQTRSQLEKYTKQLAEEAQQIKSNTLLLAQLAKNNMLAFHDKVKELIKEAQTNLDCEDLVNLEEDLKTVKELAQPLGLNEQKVTIEGVKGLVKLVKCLVWSVPELYPLVIVKLDSPNLTQLKEVLEFLNEFALFARRGFVLPDVGAALQQIELIKSRPKDTEGAKVTERYLTEAEGVLTLIKEIMNRDELDRAKTLFKNASSLLGGVTMLYNTLFIPKTHNTSVADSPAAADQAPSPDLDDAALDKIKRDLELACTLQSQTDGLRELLASIKSQSDSSCS